AGAASINAVRWGPGWTVMENQALSLDPSLQLDGIRESSDFSQWCDAGSSGSPGTQGTGCLSPWYEIEPLSARPFIDITATGTRLFDVEGNNLFARVPTGSF